MAQDVAFAAPRGEEMAQTLTGLAGAGIAGIAEGVIVKMAPSMGTAAPILTWGALLGIPTVGALGALFTRGMLGDLAMGVAAGGVGILGYSLPEMLSPTVGRKAPGLNPAGDVKYLPAGASAAQRVQTRVRSTVEF